MICDRIMQHLPILLALSANSPFWQGRNTGLHSQRVKVMETLPTAGLPPLMRNWSEYTWLLNHMVADGIHQDHPRDLVGRAPAPQLRHGRGADLRHAADLRHVLGLTALVQCLVYDLSEEIDRGTYQYDCHPFMVRQNKWRACRYGMEANLVDPTTFQSVPARQVPALAR